MTERLSVVFTVFIVWFTVCICVFTVCISVVYCVFTVFIVCLLCIGCLCVYPVVFIVCVYCVYATDVTTIAMRTQRSAASNKYLMFSYNIIFWVSHLISCLHVYSHLITVYMLQSLISLTRLHGFDPVWLVLVVGGVTFILGFAGCVGALRENICLLKFFSGVIGLIFFLELTAAVLAVVFQGQVREWINEFFLANIRAYRDDIDLQNLIDSLQRVNHCCGAQDPVDWDLNKCGVPFSCCITDPCCEKTTVEHKQLNILNVYVSVYTCLFITCLYLPVCVFTCVPVYGSPVYLSVSQMVGIYLARTLISDIEKVRFSY
uniref:Tetraspanin 14 n=1 Tax=Amphiprion percula TaxID=161767 RepID=A0A3P8T9Z2_AMPPE